MSDEDLQLIRKYRGIQNDYRIAVADTKPEIKLQFQNLLKATTDPFRLCALQGNFSNRDFEKMYQVRLDELVSALIDGPPTCPYEVQRLRQKCGGETWDKLERYLAKCIHAALPGVTTTGAVNSLFNLGIRTPDLDDATKARWTVLYSEETGIPIDEIRCEVQPVPGGFN